MTARSPLPSWSLAQATKSFIGHLEGTGAAHNTIRNYRLDVEHFVRFLSESSINPKPQETSQLEWAHIRAFDQYLTQSGFRPNSHRRKLHTLHRFFKYVAGRGRVEDVMTHPIPTPPHQEQLKDIPAYHELQAQLALLRPPGAIVGPEDFLIARNQLLASLLLESGALLTEVVGLRVSQVVMEQQQAELINARSRPTQMRWVDLPPHWFERWRFYVSYLHEEAPDVPHVFPAAIQGHILPRALSPRMAEIVFENLRPAMHPVAPALTARQLRHARVIAWLAEGRGKEEVQRYLGLQTLYALKLYDMPVLKGEPHAGVDGVG